MIVPCRFRQVALKALMQSIAEQDGESSQQFRDMRRVFEQMDRNADGRVTYSEVGGHGFLLWNEGCGSLIR